MKILNLYAGIGGNRKLWTPNGDDHEITAVEIRKDIADIYKSFFPNDNVIIGNAHKYLLEHFEEYDFIWSSPPCPTHSKVRFIATREIKTGKIRQRPVYPDMVLYQEILLLRHYFKGKYCVENVISFYKPLISPIEAGSHYFWANFDIKTYDKIARGHYDTIDELSDIKGFDLNKIKISNKRQILRNCVKPEIGKHILDCAMGIHPQQTLL